MNRPLSSSPVGILRLKRSMRSAILAAAAVSAFSTGMALSVSASAATTLEIKYRVRFVGVGVGKIVNTVRINGDAYSIGGQLETSGFARLFSAMKANFASSGRLGKSRPMPAKNTLRYKGKKSGSVNLGFAQNAVVRNVSKPVVKYKSGSVAVTDKHLKAVIDPISALVFPVAKGAAGNGRKVCNRTLPVFDGKNRFNLKLSYKRKERARAKGFKGDVFVCAVRYQPIAGHRPNKKNIKDMQKNRGTEIGFARIGNTNAYTMFNFKVPTSRGTAKGVASLFKVR